MQRNHSELLESFKSAFDIPILHDFSALLAEFNISPSVFGLSLLAFGSVVVGVAYVRTRAERHFLDGSKIFKHRTHVEVLSRDIFQGVTELISLEGAQIRLQRDMGLSLDAEHIDVILPAVCNVQLKTEVVEYVDNILSLKFIEVPAREKQLLSEWLQSQDETTPS